jgi:hypothetical protein
MQLLRSRSNGFTQSKGEPPLKFEPKYCEAGWYEWWESQGEFCFFSSWNRRDLSVMKHDEGLVWARYTTLQPMFETGV